MKKKKIISIILILAIIIAGIVMMLTKGFNYGMEYSKTTEIKIGYEQVVKLDDVKQLMPEVFGDKEVKVAFLDYFEDATVITVLDPTEEELEKLIELTNSKYELENTMETLTQSKNGAILIQDIIAPYILPVIIAFALIVLYLAIIYKKILLKAVIGSILSVVTVQLIYFSILVIFGLPITIYTMPIALSLMLVTVLIVTIKLQKIRIKLATE